MEHSDKLPKNMIGLLSLAITLRKRLIHLLYPYTQVSPLENIQLHSALYCRDVIGVIDGQAILTNLLPPRNYECLGFQRIFQRLPKQTRHSISETFPWGNVLLHDETILVGTFNSLTQSLGRRMTFGEQVAMENMNQWKMRLREILYIAGNERRIVEVELARFTDLDLAITPLPKKKAGGRSAVLVSPDVTDAGHAELAKVFDDALRCGETTRDKGYNVLWINPETAVVSKESTQVQPILRGQGYDVIALPITGILEKNDFDKKGNGVSGGWRCTVGPLRRAKDYTY